MYLKYILFDEQMFRKDKMSSIKKYSDSSFFSKVREIIPKS